MTTHEKTWRETLQKHKIRTSKFWNKQNKNKHKENTSTVCIIRTWLPKIQHFKDFLTTSTWLQNELALSCDNTFPARKANQEFGDSFLFESVSHKVSFGPTVAGHYKRKSRLCAVARAVWYCTVGWEGPQDCEQWSYGWRKLPPKIFCSSAFSQVHRNILPYLQFVKINPIS